MLAPATVDGARQARPDRARRRRRPTPRRRATSSSRAAPSGCRIPYWFGTGTPALAGAKPRRADESGQLQVLDEGRSRRASRATATRRARSDSASARRSPAPSASSGSRSTKPATNFGVVVTSRAPGVRVEPRIVRAGDERHLTGYAALPFNLNPYLRTFGELVLAAGTILPAAGSYDVVFDSPSAARAGAFTFRYWVNDVTPPALALRTPRVKRGGQIVRRAPPTAARASIRPRSSSASTATSTRAGSPPARSASPRPASARAATRSASRSPTTRSRGTWRTSAGSCRTRASCRRRSSSASS